MYRCCLARRFGGYAGTFNSSGGQYCGNRAELDLGLTPSLKLRALKALLRQLSTKVLPTEGCAEPPAADLDAGGYFYPISN